MNLRIIFLVVALFYLSGCGLKQDYGTVRANLEINGTEPVVVAVVDKRPYVLSGEKESTFVGLMRSGYGIPYDIHTNSKKPFAEVFSAAACNSLTANGFVCEPLVVAEADARNTALQQLHQVNAKQLLLFEIEDWKVDTYTSSWLRYGLTLTVLNPKGAPIASSQTNGKDNLGSSWAPSAVVTKETPKALGKKLELLINDSGVKQALTR